MKILVCAVFDKAAGVYGRPAFFNARGLATRAFADEVGRRAQDNPLSMHPEDFEIYCLGEWDDETGRFDSYVHPELMARGIDHKGE